MCGAHWYADSFSLRLVSVHSVVFAVGGKWLNCNNRVHRAVIGWIGWQLVVTDTIYVCWRNGLGIVNVNDITKWPSPPHTDQNVDEDYYSAHTLTHFVWLMMMMMMEWWGQIQMDNLEALRYYVILHWNEQQKECVLSFSIILIRINSNDNKDDSNERLYHSHSWWWSRWWLDAAAIFEGYQCWTS